MKSEQLISVVQNTSTPVKVGTKMLVFQYHNDGLSLQIKSIYIQEFNMHIQFPGKYLNSLVLQYNLVFNLLQMVTGSECVSWRIEFCMNQHAQCAIQAHTIVNHKIIANILLLCQIQLQWRFYYVKLTSYKILHSISYNIVQYI